MDKPDIPICPCYRRKTSAEQLKQSLMHKKLINSIHPVTEERQKITDGEGGNINDAYRLYHLLNHLNLFGPMYLGSVEQIIRKYAG